MKRLVIGLTLLTLLNLPIQVHAGTPLETVKTYVNRVLDVLRDPSLQVESAKELKKEKIRSISKDMFDFKVLSKLTLGRNWKRLNPDQRREFVALYRQILEKAYMDKILAYKDEKVVFGREIMLSENKAEVETKVITASNEIPIHYRVTLKNDMWRVYDVVIEGVSLVKNYRSQFREILGKKSIEELFEMLREKVDKT